jgi:hypothetical protein
MMQLAVSEAIVLPKLVFRRSRSAAGEHTQQNGHDAVHRTRHDCRRSYRAAMLSIESNHGTPTHVLSSG